MLRESNVQTTDFSHKQLINGSNCLWGAIIHHNPWMSLHTVAGCAKARPWPLYPGQFSDSVYITNQEWSNIFLLIFNHLFLLELLESWFVNILFMYFLCICEVSWQGNTRIYEHWMPLQKELDYWENRDKKELSE